MAFKGQEGNKVVQKERELWTGIIPVKVVAINPSLDQMHKMGLSETPNEPIYVTDKTDDAGNAYKMIRIDVWVENEAFGIKTKLAIFTENRLSTSLDTGKVEYINDFGRTAWAPPDTVPQDKWFKDKGTRVAYRGEGQLIKFMEAWLNADTEKDELAVDNWKAIFTGDFSELAALIPLFGTKNTLKVMLMVTVTSDSKYFQGVYPKYFARWNNDSTNGWANFVNKANNQKKKMNLPNGFWSLELKKFVIPTADNTGDAAAIDQSVDHTKAEKYF